MGFTFIWRKRTVEDTVLCTTKTAANQGIIDTTGTETFAKEP